MPRMCLLCCGLADASPSIRDALHVEMCMCLLGCGWLMRRLLYLAPRMYLLGCGLADASPSLLDALYAIAWLWLG